MGYRHRPGADRAHRSSRSTRLAPRARRSHQASPRLTRPTNRKIWTRKCTRVMLSPARSTPAVTKHPNPTAINSISRPVIGAAGISLLSIVPLSRPMLAGHVALRAAGPPDRTGRNRKTVVGQARESIYPNRRPTRMAGPSLPGQHRSHPNLSPPPITRVPSHLSLAKAIITSAAQVSRAWATIRTGP